MAARLSFIFGWFACISALDSLDLGFMILPRRSAGKGLNHGNKAGVEFFDSVAVCGLFHSHAGEWCC